MKNLAAVIILLTITMLSINAQQVTRCIYDEAVNYWDAKDGTYRERINETFELAKQNASFNQLYKTSAARTCEDTLYHIPVVFHVVYNLNKENIHDSIIKSQIDVLNRDYRLTNSDTSQLRQEFVDLGLKADVGIDFYLAETDPQGNPTTGITRTQTSKTHFAPSLFGGGFDDVKSSSTDGADAWDTDKYLNIWICNLEDPNGGFGLILGFAYPPDGAPNWPAGQGAPSPEFQGVVVHYKVIGDDNPYATGQLSIGDKGRTAVHEVGHYLGLRHIWGDGGFFGSIDCNADDGIDDTPNSGNNSQTTGCDVNKNTCDAGVNGDLPDMWENYMDYSEEECQVSFTPQQAAIMRSNLVNFRKNLYTAEICFGVGVKDTELDNVLFFPNPVEDILNIKLNGLKLHTGSVYSISGEKIVELNNFNADTVEVALGHLTAGVYFVELSTKNNLQITRKIVVQ